MQVVLINRSYDTAERAWIDLAGGAPRRVRVERLGPAAPKAGNDERADTVAPVSSEVAIEGDFVLEIPARSLVRLTYPSP